MKALHPPQLDPATLPRRVLLFAPHPDDEVLACGGMLAFHAERGDDVRVVMVTDGSLGDPDGKTVAKTDDLVAARKREAVASGEVLGVTDHRFLDLADGAVGEVPDLVARLSAELDDFAPELVYAPSPLEYHADHRAVGHAALAALAAGPERRVHLYGVNQPVTANVLYDTTRWWPVKQAAIEKYASQLQYHDMVRKCLAWDVTRTVNTPDPAVEVCEAFVALDTRDLTDYEGAIARVLDRVAGPGHGLPGGLGDARDPWAATAVISTWNKVDDVCDNVDALRAQTRPFAAIVVVDNASTDGTAERLAERYPEVRVIRTPNSAYGACETFNIGFASVTTPLLAILDDDVTLPPEWLERCVERLQQEPETTAILSTKIVEPGMPESYLNSVALNTERYMSTFRGCGSLARTSHLREAGFYDERLFIYGNERDLTCRLLNLGYRVLQYPGVETYHSNPFGISTGKRSLYFHARNAFLGMLKYAPWKDLLAMPFLVVSKVLLRGDAAEASGEVAEATGTIGIGRSVRETPGAFGVLVKAGFSVLYNVPYCLKRRQPVRHPDFDLPLK